MKYNKDTILFFKPIYSIDKKICITCQIVKYLENTKQYLAITQDIYSPGHYYKSYVYEDDLGDIKETFVINEITNKSLYINLKNNEVLKLPFMDLYKSSK